MSITLPNNSFHFKLLSFCLSIVPFEASNGKLFVIITVNLLVLLSEIIIQLVFREEIFAFVGQPVLMFLDCVAIGGPLLVHILMIFESLMKKRTDLIIWRQITEINEKLGVNSVSLQKTLRKDFLLMTLIPPIVYIAVMLATYRTQKNWALGIVCSQLSGIIYHWGIIMFVYYIRYMSDKLSVMAQEIEHLDDLTRTYKFACNVVVGRLYQIKCVFNMVWNLHNFVKTRYEMFLVFYVFLSLCGLTTSMYFLGVRLIARKFSYSLESALCLVPYMYTNVHISVVASDFGSKLEKLLNALQLLSDNNWKTFEVVSAVKSFKFQLVSASLTTDIGGHLKIEYSNIILGVVSIVTTNIFIFLFLN